MYRKIGRSNKFWIFFLINCNDAQRIETPYTDASASSTSRTMW